MAVSNKPISAAFPAVVCEQRLKELDENVKQVATNIKAAIERVQTFQTNEGGFTYWPGNGPIIGRPATWGISSWRRKPKATMCRKT
ncbi:MAG: hypothetical protein IPO07_26305 [Haliscomenobacter sp.]|nr:hypothetical protein [Haliscomenobacter sp.]MBK9491921.1 hypothetical protein [Haliscomenobacter sp.]